MNYVYILKLRDKRLYTGFCNNLKRRLREHQNGKVRSTKNLRPIRLLHCELYKLKSDALRREKFLKTTEGKRYLRKQIRDLLIKEDIIKK
jgi:putative endonuclease